MVIQKLVECYQTLQTNQCTVAPLGWNRQAISYQLNIDYNGTILELSDVQESYIDKNEKTQKRPSYYLLPCHEQARSSNDKSYFLWDNGSYIFASKLRRPKRREHHIEVHREILKNADFPEAVALLNFFEKYSDADLQTYLTETCGISLAAAENLNFMYSVNGKICGLQEEFKDLWNQTFQTWLNKQPKGIDIVTNQEGAICNTHMPIKPCANLANGAALSFTNYGSVYYHTQKQGMVAPMSYETVKAYTQAASYMAKTKEYHMDIGDLKILFWTKQQKDTEMNFLQQVLTGFSQETLQDIMGTILQGKSVDQLPFDMSEPVYVLGISTDISGKTISVAFFEQSAFGTIFQNVKAHYERLQIKGWVKDKDNKFVPDITTPKSIYSLQKSIEQNGKKFHRKFTQKLLNAILFGHPYPIELMTSCQKQAAREPIRQSQASILKAYYLHTLSPQDKRKECCTMELNENSTNPGYLLGRLFACYERIEDNVKHGNGKLHERYFSSAMTTPKQIFPLLSQLNPIYMKQLPENHRIFFDKQMGEIKAALTEYPSHLSLTEQGLFDLGYYHQKQAFFTRKPKEFTRKPKENVTEGGTDNDSESL